MASSVGGGCNVPVFTSFLSHFRCDAGQTVYADDPRLNEMMEQAGRKMKLQVHRADFRIALFSISSLDGH